jgi:predicted phosphodiesterase
MKILTLSDLHLEFRAPQPSSVCLACGDRFGMGKWNEGATWYRGPCGVCGQHVLITEPRDCGNLGNDWNLNLPDPAIYDVVVLAGDIHSHTHALEWATKTFSKPVIYVPGNHEYYDAHFHGINVELKRCVQDFPNVHLLDNASVVIDGVRFVGAVLWTNFRLYGDSPAIVGRCLHDAKDGMRDFSVIRFGSTGLMRPADTVHLFAESACYLREILREPFDGPTVVVTHHLPSMRSVATRFKDDLMSSAFASNLDDLVAQADVWIHGHTHDSFDYAIGKCRVVCNPRGYPGTMYPRFRDRYENPAFDPCFVVEV